MATTHGNNPREGLTADLWWDVTFGSTDLSVGATPLVKRCMRMHGWTLRFTMQVLEGYKTFLALKQRFQDWDGTQFTPSVPIGRMWREHLVDNGNYTKDCKLLFRKVFIYNPDESLNKEEYERRIDFTKNMLRLNLGDDYDREVWNFGVSLIESETEEDPLPAARPQQMVAAALRRTRRLRDAPANNVPVVDDAVVIRVRDQVGEETYFKIRRSTVLTKVFRTWAMRKGVRARSLRFTFNGETLTGDETAITMGLNENDIIEVFSRDGRLMRRPIYAPGVPRRAAPRR